MIGGRSYAESQFNRAVAAKRQPGSAFKPFVYLAALEKGLTPDTVREDAPITVKGWTPENYSREYFGPVTLTKALSLSLNTVAVRLGLEVGPKAVVAVAHRLGIASELEPNASIALGTSEVTPLEMVSAYAAFANGGIGVQPHVISRVRTADGKQLYVRRNASFGQVIDPQYLAMMNEMMQETLLTGTARKAELPGWQAAGKTGTSQDWRDAWFIGYTSYLVAAVWLGNDDNSPTRKVSGGNLPVEIWSRFMRAAHQGAPVAALPLGGRVADAPSPFGPLLPPLDLTGAQAPAAPVGGRGGAAPASASVPVNPSPPQHASRAAPASALDSAPIPPAPIPDRGGQPERRDRSFFDRILGTL
jgi:penicillin-binding protein 1A